MTPHQRRAYEVAVRRWKAAGPISPEADAVLREVGAARSTGAELEEVAAFVRFLKLLTRKQCEALAPLMKLIGDGYYPGSRSLR